MLASVGGAQAPQQPAADGLAVTASGDAQRGASLFRSMCGFCHGSNAGGAQGPNLVVSKFFIQGDGAGALSEFLKSGRPAVGMPPFPSNPPSDVEAIYAFVRSRAGQAQRSAMDPASILVGDAIAGERYFKGEGNCVACHSVTGDLKDISKRFDPLILQGRMINPRVVGVDRSRPDPSPARVTVILNRAQQVSGDLIQINDFFVTLMDSTGARRTFARDNDKPTVRVDDPAEAHREALLRWTDRNMWNVTAYLVSLK